mgnify:CR=1 FL=1
MKFNKEIHKISGNRSLYLYSFDENESKQKIFWGAVADNWKSKPEFVERWFSNITQEMLSVIPDKKSIVLDLGCGAKTVDFPEKTKVIGLDIAKEMLENDSCNVVGSFDKLPFQNNSFDAVFCRMSIMFASHPEQAFSECYRVLKPGGVFTFSVWQDLEFNKWAEVPMKILSQQTGLQLPSKNDPHAFRFSNEEELKRLCENANFNDFQSKKIEINIFHKMNGEEIAEKILELAGPLYTLFQKLPEEQKTQTFKEISNTYNSLQVSCNALVITVKKRG